MSEERKYHIQFSPPLVNSSNPWATTKADLLALYRCPHTGAITTRTSLLGGFACDPATQQYGFFSPGQHGAGVGSQAGEVSQARTEEDEQDEVKAPKTPGAIFPPPTSSLNTLGYSPVPFETYLQWIGEIAAAAEERTLPRGKPIIVSVTGTPDEVATCYTRLVEVTAQIRQRAPPGPELLLEINLSCPNIRDKPPPAYDGTALRGYIRAVQAARTQARRGTSLGGDGGVTLPHIGIKTPPYTYEAQFATVVSALTDAAANEDGGCPISFITATNTLGGCLVLDGSGQPWLGSADGLGVGGLGGEGLHPLALGNVSALRRLLDGAGSAQVRRIGLVGTGGVRDRAGFERMRTVGAAAVGVGTALGREGIRIFGDILQCRCEDGAAVPCGYQDGRMGELDV